MENVYIQIISTIGLVLVAALQLRAEHYRKMQARADAYDKTLRDEKIKDDLELQLAQGTMIKAVGELAYVTSLAVTGGHVNGNVEAAQKAYNKSVCEYHAREAVMARKYLKLQDTQ